MELDIQAQGDVEFFSKLKGLKGPLTHLAYSTYGIGEFDFEDIYREGLVKLLDANRMGRIDFSRNGGINYIFTAIANECKKHKNDNRIMYLDTEAMESLSGGDGDPAVLVAEREIRERDLMHLGEAWSELDIKKRYVLFEHYFRGRGYEDIGKSLGISINGSKMSAYRARKMLFEKIIEKRYPALVEAELVQG
jgi:RNA polymerase sigma factor (sigma-70 family)